MLKLLRLLNICHLVTPALKGTIHAVLDEVQKQARQTPDTADDEAAQLLIDLATIIGLY